MKFYKLGLFLSIACFVISCAGSKEARSMKKSINGNWNLETVVVEGNSSILNVKVFNETDMNCFIGSSWNFVSNNGTGSYALKQGKDGCSAVTRKIRWAIYEPANEEKKFQFKRLDDKNNPLDDNNGYRLSILSQTDSSMKLSSQISFENKPVTLIYNFIKK